MDSQEIRHAVLEHFAGGLPAARKRFDPDSGRFLAKRGGDALRDWQDEKGRFESIKADGSRWGMTYMLRPGGRPWKVRLAALEAAGAGDDC